MKLLSLVWLVAVVGCHSDAAPDPDPPLPDAADPQPPKNRVEVSPSAALLTTVGDGLALHATVLAPDGQPAPDAVTWRSSNPDAVAIDADGHLVARAAVGSAQITAIAGDAVSAPVLVVVAEPAPGAILVSDDDVIAGPTAVDEAAPFALGFRYRVTVAAATPVTAGAIMLARGGKSVAGRVVSFESIAAGTDVVLETVALPDLFRQLSVDDSYRIDEAALADALAADRARAAPLDENGTFRLGPLVCKKPSPSFSALTGDASIRLVPDVTTVRHLATGPDGRVSALAMVTGSLVATGTLSLSFSPAFEGKVSCKYKLTEIKLPIGGPISVVAGLRVPIGLKGEIGFGLQASLVEAALEIKSTAAMTMGFSYTSDTGLTPIAEMNETVDIKPKFELTESGLAPFASIKVAVGPTAGLDVGISLPLLGSASLSLLEAFLALKAEAALTLPLIQLGEPAMASSYAAKVALTVGPGSDASRALDLLGGGVTLSPALSIEKKLATSPTGTMTPDRAEVHAGEMARLTVNLDPSTTTFLGVHNLDTIRIYHTAPGGDVELLATVPASVQTSYVWSPKITDVGIHTFWATIETVLGPGIPLEITEDSSVSIHVTPKGSSWHGQISFSATGDEISSDGQTHYALSTMGSSNVTQDPTTPELLNETSSSGSLDHTQITTERPAPNPSPNACTYTTVYTSTLAGTTTAPRTAPAAQLALDEVSGVYSLYFQPAGFDVMLHYETTRSLVSGPDTCDPGGTSTSDVPASFQPEDMYAVGSIAPGARTISGTVTLETGLSPHATYQMTWTLTRD